MKNILKQAFMAGNNNSFMPDDNWSEGFEEWYNSEGVKLLTTPAVVGRSEQLKDKIYLFRDMYCQNVDISTIDEFFGF